jgi:hypothetical protein
MNLEQFEDKQVFVILKNKRKYSGKIIEVIDSGVSMIDKFGMHIWFSSEEIEVMEEEK